MNNTKKERVNLLLRKSTAKQLRKVKTDTGLPIGAQVDRFVVEANPIKK